MKEQERDALEELGDMVNMLFQRVGSAPERLSERCARIQELDCQIRMAESELRQLRSNEQEPAATLKPTGTCDCGAELHATTEFCGRCEKAVDQTIDASECPVCHHPIARSDKSCLHCGARNSCKECGDGSLSKELRRGCR